MGSWTERARTAAKLASPFSFGCDFKASMQLNIGQRREQNDDLPGERQADPAGRTGGIPKRPLSLLSGPRNTRR